MDGATKFQSGDLARYANFFSKNALGGDVMGMAGPALAMTYDAMKRYYSPEKQSPADEPRARQETALREAPREGPREVHAEQGAEERALRPLGEKSMGTRGLLDPRQELSGGGQRPTASLNTLRRIEGRQTPQERQEFAQSSLQKATGYNNMSDFARALQMRFLSSRAGGGRIF